MLDRPGLGAANLGFTNLRITVLREVPDDSALREQWNSIVFEMSSPQVFYTYEWALAVYRAYHATLRPLLFLAYDERDSLRGVAALATGPSGKEASFLCATTGDYCDFLSSVEDRAAFVDEVFAGIRKLGIAAAVLANLSADSATVPAIHRAAGNHNFHCFARTAYECAQVVLSSLERRGEEKPVLPRKKMLRRFVNAMGREAPVRLEHARSWSEVQPIFPEFARAHVARFLATGRISNLARFERRVFLEELAKLLSGTGWLALTRMMTGTKAVAWNYGFQFHDRWFWYQPTFDCDLEKYSPGFCLLAKLIEEAAENKTLQVIDLGLGAEDYKERFANRTRETLYVTLHTSVARHFGAIVRFRVASMVRTIPGLETRVRSVAAKLERVGKRSQGQGFAGTLLWFATKVRDLCWSQTEVFFYEWNGPAPANRGDWELRPLDLNQLANAAEQYADDESSLAHFLRSAQRLRAKNAKGFALIDAKGIPVHFAWISAFEGFLLDELNAKVESPSPEAELLFDCWTPVAERGHGYYGRAIGLIANQVRSAGKRPWIYSAATNTASVRGIEKAGFERRYSLVRQKVFNLQRIKGQPPVSQDVPPAEVSAPV
jgi:CelD/BcsL family acetyltransferase involved in cellulose biosynthesis